MIADIISAQNRDNMKEWAARGYPKTKNGFPDVQLGMTKEPELGPIGQAINSIRVHGGLTYSGSPHPITEASWRELIADFPKAREIALQFPLGDAAQWLKKWGPAEHSFEEFQRILQQNCICFDPPDDDIWLFGFDCAHAGDRVPAIEARLKSLDSPVPTYDEYRTLEYVIGECEQLASQLASITSSEKIGGGDGQVGQ
jgi:hypothetical protein